METDAANNKSAEKDPASSSTTTSRNNSSNSNVTFKIEQEDEGRQISRNNSNNSSVTFKIEQEDEGRRTSRNNSSNNSVTFKIEQEDEVRPRSNATQLLVRRTQSVKEFSPTKLRRYTLRWNLLWAILVIGLGLMPSWIFAFGCGTGWAVVATVLLVVNATFWMAAAHTWRTMWLEWKEYKAHLSHGRVSPKEDDDPMSLAEAARPSSARTSSVLDNDNTQTRSPLYSEENVTPPAASIITSNGNAEAPSKSALTHLCVMAAYREPMSLICASVDSVVAQTCADRTIMVVGFEEGTPNYEAKCDEMHRLYGDHTGKFRRFLTTVHPKFLPGEVAGTCSNVNWAVRQCTALLRDEGRPLDPKLTLLTKCDTDTIFSPRYFDVLERVYLSLGKEERLESMYQSVLCYNIGLDRRCVLARVTGILRTFFMCGFLVPFNINTMSIYSLSLHLSRCSQYWHPGYQMEDIMMNLNLMNGIGRRVPIVLLPIPTLSGPTSGASIWSECREWQLQARRWTIGAAEVFHYFVTKLVGGKFDQRSGLNYGFVFTWYYGIMLCVTGIFGICSLWSLPAYGCMASSELGGVWWLGAYPWISPTSGFIFFFGVKYVFVFGTAFLADAFHRSILGVEEPTLGFAGGITGVLRSVLHWLSSQLVLWCYSIVEMAAIVELAFRGRAVCAHIPSRKESLVDASLSIVDTYAIAKPSSSLCSSSKASSHGDANHTSIEILPLPKENKCDLFRVSLGFLPGYHSTYKKGRKKSPLEAEECNHGCK